MTTPQSQPPATPNVDRRALLATLAASGAALAVGTANAQEGHEHHHAAHADHSGPAPHQALVDAALDCVKRGEVCANHCISLLGQGDTALKDCLRSVLTMMPACEGLARLAAFDAKRLKEFAKVCSDICEDCQAECKKHAEHHAACKACGESCAACVEECKKVI